MSTPLQATPLSPSSPSYGSSGVLASQIKALVKKDFIILRSHRRAMLKELLFPIVMSAIACLEIVLFLKLSMGRSSPGSVRCNLWGSTVYPPELDLPVGMQYNTSVSGDYFQCTWNLENASTPTEFFQNFDDWAIQPSNAQNGQYLGYFMNGTQLELYAYALYRTYSSIPVGTYLNAFYNGVPQWTPVIGYASWPMSYNIKQTFCSAAAILFALSFAPMCATMAGQLVDEKKAKVREHLRVMGVSSMAYLSATFVTASIRVFFVCLVQLILLLSFGVVEHAGDLLILWFSMILFGFSLAAFAQIMPAFFARSTFSNGACQMFVSFCAVGGVFSTMLPSEWYPLFAVFLSPVAFVYVAAQTLFGATVLVVSPAGALGLLGFHVVLYACLGQYLYSVNPGEYGVPKPLLFPVYDLIEFFKKIQRRNEGRKAGSLPCEQLLSEGAAADGADRIVLRDLVKFYGNSDVAAVNKLSINIHQREIFALLGHNGAGKTTAISILIGMLPATSYDVATVLGYDLNTQMDDIRLSIGCCPQFDVLFDDLSAREHMDLFAACKGQTSRRADELLRKLKLPQTDQKASTFSGGMKRRLSVATALVGDSPIIFLDEPSSGLDPMSRRQLWELIKEEKHRGKSIVLTTHFMEEADYLGDRIGIMSHGAMRCCDTSEKLKQTYGVGYYLNFVKGAESQDSPLVHAIKKNVGDAGDEAVEGVVINQREQHHNRHDADSRFHKPIVEAILNRFATGWTLHHESVADTTYLLPPSAQPAFGELLTEVEAQLASIGASSYGLSMNTLEDVFVYISDQEAAKKTAGKPVDKSLFDTTKLSSGQVVETLFSQAVEVSTMAMLLHQILAVMFKKRLVMFRSVRIVFMTIVLPILMVAIGYLTIFPNFGGGSGGGGGSYNYNAQWEGEPFPDMRHGHLVLYQENDNFTDEMRFVLDTFSQNYVEYQKHLGVSDASFVYDVVSKTSFRQGSFLNGGTISFITNYNPVVQMRINDNFGVLYPGNTSQNIPPQIVYNYSYHFSDQNYAAAYMTIFEALFSAAIEKAYRVKTGGDFAAVVVPNMLLKLFTLPDNATATPVPAATPVPTPSPDSGSDRYEQKYMLVPLAAFITICIGQFAASVILPLADDVNKHIYQTFRLHGCSAASYWLGTLLYDSISGLVLVVAYIAGAYIRQVEQLQNEILVFQCLILILTVIDVLLMAYCIVLLLPENLKPNTYIYVVSGGYYLTMLIPLLIDVGIMVAGSDVPHWVMTLTPGRALFSAISIKPDTVSGVWADKIAKNCFLSVTLWNIPWTLILLYHAYVSPRFQLFGRPAAVVPESQLGGYSAGGVPATGETHPLISGLGAAVVGRVLMDSDVLAEQARAKGNVSSNMAATIHLRKVYQAAQTYGSDSRQQSAIASFFAPKIDKIAVEDLTFGIYPGECFGLLGPNGAGKTTAVKMLMRESCPTFGEVLFPYDPNASNIHRGLFGSIDEAYKHARFGCCQQGDTLWENLSAKEHMQVYLKCRLGPLYRKQDWTEYIDNAIHLVQLSEAGEKKAEAYSGGMKRKLSVCIAMYTGARMVFLDEPSTGMDPYARRALWKSIHEALRNDRSVLLTTHSMEEADAVCARIGIMTNGTLRCIGSSQHLKNRFGTGYTIVLTLKARDQFGNIRQGPEEEGQAASPNYSPVEGAAAVSVAVVEVLPMDHPAVVQQNTSHGVHVDTQMKKIFQTCELKEVLGLQRRYAVATLPALSFAFLQLQGNKDQWGLSNYSVSQQTTLEQIFINFAGSGAHDNN
jgi:ABC-type multidrug transport system ATPase subunit